MSNLVDKETAVEFTTFRHIRRSPKILYGMFTELTQQYYSSADNLPDYADTFVYSPDKEKTKLIIEPEYEWNDEQSDRRPAIYIKLGPVQYGTYAGNRDRKVAFDTEQGEAFFNRTTKGQAVWVHIGRSNMEALILSESTFDFLDGFSSIIKRDFCFDRFNVISYTPLSMAKEARERFMSNITVEYSFEESWSLKTESPKLKRIVNQAIINLSDLNIRI